MAQRRRIQGQETRNGLRSSRADGHCRRRGGVSRQGASPWPSRNPTPCRRCAFAASASPMGRRESSPTSASTSCRAASTPWSARTVPASRPWSRSSPASSPPTRARCCWRGGRRHSFADRGAGRRRLGGLPGPEAVPAPWTSPRTSSSAIFRRPPSARSTAPPWSAGRARRSPASASISIRARWWRRSPWRSYNSSRSPARSPPTSSC